MKYCKKEFNGYDVGDPEKIVMVGDEPHVDILFGNLNRMATVWVNGIENYFTEDWEQE